MSLGLAPLGLSPLGLIITPAAAAPPAGGFFARYYYDIKGRKMFKNVATKVTFFIFDSTTGLPKTGDAANLTAYVSKDYGAVTVLGDTSATEDDATNAKGMYTFDTAQAESNGDDLKFTCKSSTSNIVCVPQFVTTTPNLFTTLAIDASGRVDLGKLLGTAVSTPATAGIMDINVKNMNNVAATAITTIKAVQGLTTADTIATYTGNTKQTGDVYAALPANFSAFVIDATGRVNAFLIGILTSVFTEGATGRIAAAFKQFFNIASPAATMDHGILVDTVTTATTATNLTNAPTAGDLTAAMKTSVTTAATAATPIAASVTGAVGSVTGNVGGNVVGTVASVVGAVGSVTGLTASNLDTTISSRAAASVLGAAVGASISADIAAVKAVDDAVKAKTDNLPAAPASTTNITAAAGIRLSATGVADLLTTALTEAYAADGVAPTLTQLLFLVQQSLTEFAISGTTITAKKLDGATSAATFTLDSSTAPTSRTRAT